LQAGKYISWFEQSFVQRCGAKLVLADIDQKTFNVDAILKIMDKYEFKFV
jgi:dTDP-4-amino-4,6-dideoxygalactose transaminase